jgi:hypothetical protein
METGSERGERPEGAVLPSGRAPPRRDVREVSAQSLMRKPSLLSSSTRATPADQHPQGTNEVQDFFDGNRSSSGPDEALVSGGEHSALEEARQKRELQGSKRRAKLAKRVRAAEAEAIRFGESRKPRRSSSRGSSSSRSPSHR